MTWSIGGLKVSFYRDEWLPHLQRSIPPEARRNRISLYTIALEGWRRGLTLTFHMNRDYLNNKQLFYSLRNERRIHYFNESSGDKNTIEAFKICHDKALTNKYLQKANVPVPQGKTFNDSTSIDDILKYAENLPFPLVVKPTDGNSGQGVIVNIKSKQELKSAINRVRNQLKYRHIIVQQHVDGDEVRIYVLGDKVLAATNRRPANIVGDGKSTIINLIEQKNEFRKQIPHLHYRPIRPDAEVRKMIADAGYTLESVLKKGERLYLRKVSNVSTGGDPIDVTDQLTSEQKQIAINATKAIPGLTHCGVDMIINGQSGIILELNTRPGIGSHLFPVEGKARDIPKAIIDYYFPETKGTSVAHSNLYFDLQTVFDATEDKYLSELTIKNHPKDRLHTKKFLISGDLDLLGYYERFKKRITQHNFNGYMKKTEQETVEIVLGHESVDEIESFKTFLHDKRRSFQIRDIVEKNWDEPIRRGFELIDGFKQLSLNELENANRQLRKNERTLEIETNRLNKRIEQMKQSRAWRLTAPIRKIKDLIKK